jgi:MGT family glycosyltransferase
VNEPLRIVVGSVGFPGHAFPAIALARELRARGHQFVVQTSERWRERVEGFDLELWPAAESVVLPGWDAEPGRPLADAARSLQSSMREFDPDVVVSDLFTYAPALAAEASGIPRASLIPHLYTVRDPSHPFYPLGFLPPRTPLGSAMWRAVSAVEPLLGAWFGKLVRALNATRAQLGLQPIPGIHQTASDGLVLVATFPQLEYPRRWPEHVHVTGPMLLDSADPEVELPPGGDPLVVVNTSTSQDPELRLVGTALEALAEEPVRVVATTGDRGDGWAGRIPANAAVVNWVSYRQVMPETSLVLCSGGHGTVVTALAWGVPVLVRPSGGDMAENGARAAWAGAGLVLPGRLLRPGPLRWAVRRMLAEPGFAERARRIAAWTRGNDGAARGADLVELYARESP